jgi:curved DNA-binding protein
MELHHAFAELGLKLHSTTAEAKSAYRTLAMRWHPDVSASPDADTRMKTINVAYEVVTRYLAARDKAATTPKPKPAAAQATSQSGAKAASGFSEFDWHTGFASRATGSAPPRERLVQRTVQVSLFEAAFGCVKRVRGLAAGAGRTEGQAWVVTVRIHAGTLDGAAIAPEDIRVCTFGHALPRAFKLSVQIEKHPLFKLDRDRLSVSVPMSVWRWALGGALAVPTLEGHVQLHLAPRSGVVLVKNQGWPLYKQPQQRQPLFVMPQRVFPQSLSDQDRRLLQALDAGARLPEVEGWLHSVHAWMESSAHGLV